MRHMTGVVCVLVGLMAAAAFACRSEKDEKAERDALRSAEAWLELLDRGAYGESWDEASSFVRDKVPREDWASQIKAARRPPGENLTRRVKSRTYRESLPGAPDGKYVIIQFESSFQNKRGAVETVTPMLDEDGVWRVSGYFIK